VRGLRHVVTAWQAPGTYQENGQTIHVVDFNESPATIRKKYGIKTDDLLKANNISDAKKVSMAAAVIPQQQAPTTVASTTANLRFSGYARGGSAGRRGFAHDSSINTTVLSQNKE